MEMNIDKLLTEQTLDKVVQYGMEFGKNIIVALIVYLVCKYVIGKVTRLFRALLKSRNVEPSLATFFDNLVTICLYLVLAIAIIGILGFETSSFVALFASAGVAVGLALSGTLQNFAGGVMILLFRPFRVGDVIEAQGFAGCVKQIQIFNTVLCTVDNQTIIIPNGGLSTGSIKNYSTQPHRRVDINVEVAYGTKPEDVRNILNAIIAKDSRILTEGALAPAMPMTAMGASSIVIQLRVWTDSANYWGVMGDTTEAIYNELTKAGIEIPFQQIDVHMR